MLALYVLFGGLFTFLAWKNIRWAVLILLAALPTYLIRFNVGPLPTTLLEVMFGSVFLAWVLQHKQTHLPRIMAFFKAHRLFSWSLVLFFVASVVSIFTSDMWYYSFGQWRAYFLEPMLFFLVLVDRRDTISGRDVGLALIVSTISISVVGLVQKITGAFYPPSLWDDQLFGRITSFYTSPNAAALYLAPIAPLTVLFLEKNGFTRTLNAVAAMLMLLALYCTHSLGAHIALAVGALVFFASLGYKKIVVGLIILGGVLFLLPHTKAVLASKAQSTSNRRTLWTMSANYLTESPKNFVFGTGIRQFFRKIQKEDYNPKELERLIYPHNIFLNFWTETGLLGMLSFAGLLVALLAAAYQTLHTNKLLGATLLAALSVFIIHGLVDVPYFKNDLAILFWALAFVVLTTKLAARGGQSY